MIKVVSVKFKNGGKPYYFAPKENETYEKGAGVIVETAKGLEYATVVAPECEVEDDKIVAPLKPVVRKATPRDEEQVKRNAEKRGETMQIAREKIAARGLEMKVVDCEFAFDGSKIILYFTSENRVDFRELIKDLSSAFHMRIELRQINIRDEIKLTGGIAPCGRECCCLGCMPEPKKVSVKMAKNQGLSLNPQKISGLCGRLMCCLSYEDEFYSEACKKVPKLGGTVETPAGNGTVVNVNMLKMQVKVKIEQNDAVSYHDFGVDEIRFMRGNVVMGNEHLGEEDAENKEQPQPPEEQEEIIADGETPPKPDNREKKGGDTGDRRERKGDNRDRDSRNRQRGNGGQSGKPQGNRDNNRENREKRGNRNNRPNNNGKGGSPENRGGRPDNKQNNSNVKPENKQNGRPNNKRRHGDRKSDNGQNGGQGN